MRNLLAILMVAGLITGCTVLPQPQTATWQGRGIGIPQSVPSTLPQNLPPTLPSTINRPIEASVNEPLEPRDSEYGLKPRNYPSAIKNYFSSKLKRGAEGRYRFGKPKRAYKRKGLAYGGALSWKGWLVETLVSTPTRTGRYLTPKPYMVLFKGEQIVEHILGNSHKLLVKVDK